MRLDSILHCVVKWCYLYKSSILSDLHCLQFKSKRIHPSKFFLWFNEYMDLLEHLIKVLLLIQSIWGGARDSVLLISSWVMGGFWSVQHTLNCKSPNNLITNTLLHLFVIVICWEQAYHPLRPPCFRWFAVVVWRFYQWISHYDIIINIHIFKIELKSMWSSGNS